jgi:putative transposase
MIESVGLRILLVALSGWVNRHQLEVIAYLRAENRVLKEHVGGRRLRLTDLQRRRLAATGHRLGRRALTEVATLVTPDTILRWRGSSSRGNGRPYDDASADRACSGEIGQLTVRMARENPTWGYRRIQGALKNLGHGVARSTIATILRAQGMAPVPRRSLELLMRGVTGAIGIAGGAKATPELSVRNDSYRTLARAKMLHEQHPVTSLLPRK